jgi:hypothetical protein
MQGAPVPNQKLHTNGVRGIYEWLVLFVRASKGRMWRTLTDPKRLAVFVVKAVMVFFLGRFLRWIISVAL